MAEKMTLEMALSAIDRSIRTLRDAGFAEQAAELTEARAPVSAQFASTHLTPPAQAVDVDFTISDSEPRILTWHGEDGCRPATDEEIALWDKLRALGNAQAEGWRPIETAPKDGRAVWVRGWNYGIPSKGRHQLFAWWDGAKWIEANSEGSTLLYLTDWRDFPTPPQPEE